MLGDLGPEAGKKMEESRERIVDEVFKSYLSGRARCLPSLGACTGFHSTSLPPLRSSRPFPI